MKNYQLIIFDLDGSLVKDQTTEPLPGVVDKLKMLNCHVAVATNQGKARWVLKKSELDIDARAYRAFKNSFGNGVVWAVSYAYQYEDGTWSALALSESCDDQEYWWSRRKPYPGMLFEMMEYFGVSQKDTLFVGDMETDKQAAENAGCDFMWAKDFFGWE